MMNLKDARGFSMLETLVSLTVLSLTLGSMATMLIHNSQVNKTQQIASKTQADARNCMTLIVQRLRSAGWDPMDLGFDAVTVDPVLDDDINWIEMRADLNGDGDLDEEFEQIVVRHVGTQVQWRTTALGDFVPLANEITNDSDGDGVVEPMFVANGNPPTSVAIVITAESAIANPRTAEPVRYTIENEIDLRARRLALR